MSFKYLNLSGLEDLWINIKNYILSKVPTKTSELTNDSGYLTSHQSLDNYVTLNTSQTITAIKTITGGNQGKMLFKNPNYTKGDAVESGVTVSRLYFGNGASYATANGILTFDINSLGNTSLELAALNNTASSSYRASLIITYDKSATRPRLLKSWGDFVPYSNNSYTLGTSSSIWKECYSNAYYLGSTAFGDIVTHNANEFLTDVSDASVASADEFSSNQDVTLTGDVTGTASSKAGWTVSTTLSDSGVTAGTYGPSTDVSGTNNTTILVPEITVDSKGRITSVTNRTYTSVNTDNDKRVHQYYKTDDNVYRVLLCYDAGNTSTSTLASKYTAMNNAFYANPSTGSLYATKLYSGGAEVSVSGHTHTVSDITDISSLGLDTVLQTKATDSTAYPILLGATANNSNTITDSTKFNTSLKANPRYGLISLTNTFSTGAGKGVTPSSDTAQGTVAMYTQDTGDECAALRTYAYANGLRGMFMRVYNWTNGTDVSPSGTAKSCSLGVYVDKTGTAYCKASTALWASDFIPQSNETGLIGTGSQRWASVYAKNMYADNFSGDRSCKLKLNLTSWGGVSSSHTISGVPLAPIYIMGSITFKTKPFTATLAFSGVLDSNGKDGMTITQTIVVTDQSMTQTFYAQGFVTDTDGDISLQITGSNSQGNAQPTAFTLKVYQ